MATTKISIAIDEKQLRLARKGAKSEGLSLSGYIGRALGNQLEDQERLDAARKLHKEWGPESVPTPREREIFRAKMSRSRKRHEKAA
ncbi:MAG TPA: hypothetical protein VGY54_12055 [Polyangiaceae bacterium]|nr:hypothetical protein [Polyangiaceae bacterium]